MRTRLFRRRNCGLSWLPQVSGTCVISRRLARALLTFPALGFCSSLVPGPPNKRLKLAGARRLWNESFFSAPQLKRDSLGGGAEFLGEATRNEHPTAHLHPLLCVDLPSLCQRPSRAHTLLAPI